MDTWFLDGDSQEAAEDSFDGCTSIIVLLIILADQTGDGAGVEADRLALYYTETDERARQFDADLLEKGMGRVGKEGTEAFERGGLLIRVESEGSRDGRVFQQMGVEFSEKAHT